MKKLYPYSATGTIISRASEVALREISRAERALQEAQVALDLATAEYEVAVARYAALRDKFVENHYFGGPWPPTDEAAYPNDAERCLDGFIRGQLRYVGMDLGDAIDWVLNEAEGEPLTLDEIGSRLRDGGLRVAPRQANAALLRLRGVIKTPDGYVAESKYKGPPLLPETATAVIPREVVEQVRKVFPNLARP